MGTVSRRIFVAGGLGALAGAPALWWGLGPGQQQTDPRHAVVYKSPG
jgi:hypothetical protein